MDDPTGIAIPRPTQPYAGTIGRLTDDCEPARMCLTEPRKVPQTW